jgi:GNAT superfamily N-acetyltransferase
VVTYRLARFEDNYALYRLFFQTIDDFMRRTGLAAETGETDPQVIEGRWEIWRPLFEHLARTAEHSWVAERDGEIAGYARSILRDGHRELTEFFVLPGEQSAGVGRELLRRTFPREGAIQRTIIATTDLRALARYLKEGLYPRFPIVQFSRVPQPVSLAVDLDFESLEDSPNCLEILGELDRSILGFRRDADHRWLLLQRSGYLYTRDGRSAGYGYIGKFSGPFCLHDPQDFPVVLAHAEQTAASSLEQFSLEVPLANQAAVDYLLKRGYQMHPFFALYLTDHPVGRFENYILTSPPFFV